MIWVIPAALALGLWPPVSVRPRWLVRAVVVACLAAWLLRWLVPEWVAPTLWLMISLYELASLRKAPWRSFGVAAVAIAVMLAWPKLAPFADFAGVSPEIWSSAVAGVCAALLSPAPLTRALVSAGVVLFGGLAFRDELQMSSVFVFAAMFEACARWMSRTSAGSLEDARERSGH